MGSSAQSNENDVCAVQCEFRSLVDGLCAIGPVVAASVQSDLDESQNAFWWSFIEDKAIVISFGHISSIHSTHSSWKASRDGTAALRWQAWQPLWLRCSLCCDSRSAAVGAALIGLRTVRPDQVRTIQCLKQHTDAKEHWVLSHRYWNAQGGSRYTRREWLGNRR
eukprot:COSAG02_NODE_895_length_16129_cov_25.044604_13_plen_165_part_00